MASTALPRSDRRAALSGWRGDALALALLALLVAATRGIWLGDPVAEFDEQLYSYIGWRMQYGELPFVDWWDRKPFGLLAIFGVAHALLGPGPEAYQIVAAGFAMAAAWLTYYLARMLADRMAATIAAAIAVMLLAAYGSYSGQSEVFFAPLMLGMVRLLAVPDHPRFARNAAMAMLLGGLALQVKYTVLPQCLFLGLYALWVQRRAGASTMQLGSLAALYALLGLLPTIVIALYYAVLGHFDAYFFANFLSFFDRVAAPQGRWVASHAPGVAPLAILVAGGIYAAFRMIRPGNFALWLLLLGWTGAALLSVLLPGTVYLYYYAALAAPCALVAVPLFDRAGPAQATFGLLLVLACFSLLSLDGRRATSLAERAAAQELARAIAPHVDGRGNCLWLWDGPTALYRMTGSCVPTRFVYPDHLNNALETPALGIDQTGEVARILATRPAAIVTANRAMTLQNRDAAALVKAALESSYEATTTATMHNRELTVWLRRD